MGYTTEFTGQFEVSPPLTDEQIQYLARFSETRRMARNLPAEYGVEGEFYVEGEGMCGQAREASIIDYNNPPRTQPGLWCQWVPTEDGRAIQWNEAEKFYDSPEWLKYLITNFIAPSGRTVNGTVLAQGEESGDIWVLKVTNNNVEVLESFMFPVQTTEVTDAEPVHEAPEYPRLFPISSLPPAPRGLNTEAEYTALTRAVEQLGLALRSRNWEEVSDALRGVETAAGEIENKAFEAFGDNAF